LELVLAPVSEWELVPESESASVLASEWELAAALAPAWALVLAPVLESELVRASVLASVPESAWELAAASEPVSGWGLVSELATAKETASAYPWALAPVLVLVLVTASAWETATVTVLRLVSESLLVLDSDSVSVSQSRWFRARRIIHTLTRARESRITNRISFFISVFPPGTTNVRPRIAAKLKLRLRPLKPMNTGLWEQPCVE
jgi:hypothetical protein